MNVAYCTISAANYLPRVRVLERSFRHHNPDVPFHILLVEQPDICSALALELGRELVAPPDVCALWKQMAFYYDVTEFSTALKPFFIEYLFARGYEVVVYLDPDMEVFAPLSALTHLTQRFELVLTPHVCEPMPLDGLRPGPDEIIKAGVYNLGFIGMRATPQVRAALDWWRTVCTEQCLFDAAKGLFVDQFWASIFPCFIQEFYCLRAAGYNVAYWNLFQRDLHREGGIWKVGNENLLFFHFSGVTWSDLTLVSRHQNRISAPTGSHLYQLLLEYGERVKGNDWSKFSKHPYSFGSFLNHETISLSARRYYLSLSASERAKLGDPFVHPARFPCNTQSEEGVIRWGIDAYRSVLGRRGWIGGHAHIARILLTRLLLMFKRNSKA